MITAIRKELRDNDFFYGLICMLSTFMLIYLLSSTSNVPIMDYWRYLNSFVEKSFLGGVSFSDIYSSNGIHRSPLQMLSLLANIHIFHWNTRIEIIAGGLMKAATFSLLYYILKKNDASKKTLNLLTFSIGLIVFSLASYEILTLEFSFSFELRIFFLLFLLYKINNKLLSSLTHSDFFLSFGCFFFVAFMGGATFPAFIGALIFVTLIYLLTTQKNSIFTYAPFATTLCVFLFAGTVLYCHGWDMDNSHSAKLNDIGNLFFLFSAGIPLVCGTSLFGDFFSIKTTTGLGCIVLATHLFSFIIYIRRNYYKKNLIPFFLYVYVAIFYMEILFGRSGNGIGSLAASRYVPDIILALISDIFIAGMSLSEKKHKTDMLLSLCSLLIIITGVFLIDFKEFKIADKKKNKYDKLVEKMIDIKNCSDDELAGFESITPVYIRNGVEIMRKYKLGIFHNKIDYIKKTKGFYDDGWITQECEFDFFSDAPVSLQLSFFNPSQDAIDSKIINVYANEKLEGQIEIQNGMWTTTVPIPFSKSHTNKIVLKTDYLQKASNGDTRNLSLILMDMRLVE